MTDTAPDIVTDAHGNQVLLVPVDDTHGHAIALDAIASWGELLGLDDEQALAAILTGQRPPAGEGDDNGWTGLYDQLVEEEVTDMLVERATASLAGPRPRQHESVEGVPQVVADTVETYGPDLVRAQTAAVREDRQRAARQAMAIDRRKVPADVRDLVRARAGDLAARRRRFRAGHRPTTPDGGAA